MPMNFKTELLPYDTTSNLSHSLGSNTVGWKTYGTLNDTYGHTVEYIKGTLTTSTGTWTGVSKDSSLYDGKMIMYVLPYAGSGDASLTLTLTNPDGTTTTTGAIPIYRYGTTTRITTHYAAKSRILLIYNAADNVWNSHPWYDTGDTKVRLTLSTANKNYPLLLAYNENTNTSTTYDNVAYRNNSIYANPSTGTIYATLFDGTASYAIESASANYAATASYAASANYATTATESASANYAGYVSYPLKIGNKIYNGSDTVTVAVEDLGLALPVSMTFIGVITENLTNGDTTSPVHLKTDNTTASPTDGAIVIDNENLEFIWSNSAWASLGVATDYALAQHRHGNIENSGIISTSATIASGDSLIIADSSGSNILNRSSITFDGSTTGLFLSKKGTWSMTAAYAGTATNATKDGNGDAITATYLKLSGGTMTGLIQKAGVSKSWHDGRDGAALRINSISGYSPAISVKTTTGSWEIGVYSDSDYQEQLIFAHVPDSCYNVTNTGVTQGLRFGPKNNIVASGTSTFGNIDLKNLSNEWGNIAGNIAYFSLLRLRSSGYGNSLPTFNATTYPTGTMYFVKV